jgi:hypothetical protein
MAWCEATGVDYIFGLPGSKPLSRKVDETADAVRTERAVTDKPVVRGYCETRHGAKSWNRERRAIARVEATTLGLDIRFVVTNIDHGSAEWIYDSLYCARGEAENLIKLHKSQLASDRTSCRSAIANQVRLALAAFCPEADLIHGLPGALAHSDRDRRGNRPRRQSPSLPRVQKYHLSGGDKPHPRSAREIRRRGNRAKS